MERRTLNRVVQRIAAKFQAGSVRGEGYLKNVSKKGMFLRDRRGVDVEIVGKVAWTTKQLPPGAKAQPGFGISIDRDDPAFVEFFEQILFS